MQADKPFLPTVSYLLTRSVRFTVQAFKDKVMLAFGLIDSFSIKNKRILIISVENVFLGESLFVELIGEEFENPDYKRLILLVKVFPICNDTQKRS